MNDTIPWYKSQVLIGALVSILLKVLVLTGLVAEVTPEDSEQLASTIVLVLSGLGDLWAMRARLVQKTAPAVTLGR